jgi:acyl dehydratase
MSTSAARKALATTLDLSDLQHRVGKLVGGGQLWDACQAIDIRRWVMALDYPNPIHWDEEFARNSKFGGIVAPQSICVALDVGHGVQPACVGHIPDSHFLFGGEEWWFYGHRVRPGDKLFQERKFYDYKVAETKFAGPSVFTRGDTIHRTQDGIVVAKERSTGARYLAAEAEKRKMFETNNQDKIPTWTQAQLDEVRKVRFDWIMSNRNGVSPHFEEIEVGDKLPQRAIGPHSVASFTTEYRACLFNIWGSYGWVGVPGVKDPWINQDPGWLEGLKLNYELAKIDPYETYGVYMGPSAAHVDGSKGTEFGMPRGYGFGATMGGWATDYLAYWAGHDGMVRHSRVSFRAPAFEGDVTYVDGQVVGKSADSPWGGGLITIKLQMTNQDGVVLVDGAGEVEVPL